jgi:hypothetical protein
VVGQPLKAERLAPVLRSFPAKKGLKHRSGVGAFGFFFVVF